METIATKKRQRVSPRVPDSARDLLEKAAEIYGATVSQFIVQAAVKKAHAVIERERLIKLTLADFRVLARAIEHPAAPNARLKRAWRQYGKSIAK